MYSQYSSITCTDPGSVMRATTGQDRGRRWPTPAQSTRLISTPSFGHADRRQSQILARATQHEWSFSLSFSFSSFSFYYIYICLSTFILGIFSFFESPNSHHGRFLRCLIQGGWKDPESARNSRLMVLLQAPWSRRSCLGTRAWHGVQRLSVCLPFFVRGTVAGSNGPRRWMG